MKEYRRDPIDDELIEVETDDKNSVKNDVKIDNNQDASIKDNEDENGSVEEDDEDPFDSDDPLQFDSIEDLMRQLGQPSEDGPRPKNMRVINFPQRLSYNVILNTLYSFIMNTMIIFSLLGYTKMVEYESIFDVVFYALIFSGVEILAKEVLYYYKPMWVLKSLGSLLLAITVLSFLTADLVLKRINFISTSALVFFILVFLIVRSIVTNIIINKRIEKIFRGGRKNG